MRRARVGPSTTQAASFSVSKVMQACPHRGLAYDDRHQAGTATSKESDAVRAARATMRVDRAVGPLKSGESRARSLRIEGLQRSRMWSQGQCWVASGTSCLARVATAMRQKRPSGCHSADGRFWPKAEWRFWNVQWRQADVRPRPRRRQTAIQRRSRLSDRCQP